MRNLFWCFLVIGCILNSGVLAQPEMDPTFGSSGKTVITFGALASAQDIAVQPDNKVILVSACFHIDLLSTPFCAIRMNENGVIDNTFRSGNPSNPNGGGVYTKFSGASIGAVSGVAIQSDGKVILAGYATMSGNENVAVVRYGTDGVPDTSFGPAGTGIVFTDVTPGINDRAAKVAVQSDGKIVVVGYSGNDQFLARYLPDGTLDGSFGTGGMVKTAVAGTSILARVLEILPDGRIMAGGYLQSGNSNFLTRFNPDGSPDTSWDGDGVLIMPTSLGWGIIAMAVQLDGRVVALGYASTAVIYRFNTDGSLDTTFDGDGSRPTPFAESTVEASDLMVSASGKIMVVGHQRFVLHSFGTWWYFTTRYLPDGSLDTSYSGDGFLNFDVGASHNDGAMVVALDPVGRYVFGGFSALGSAAVPYENPVFSAARVAAPPVMSVSVSGRVTRADGTPVAGATVSTSGTSVRTNPFGYYTFPDVQTNQTYIFSIRAKNLVAAKRTILVDDQIANLDFTAVPMTSRLAEETNVRKLPGK